MSEVDDLVERLGLERHPEGGWFRRTWTHHDRDADGRAAASAILYLLGAGERSHWHRIDAVEQWHFHAGSPLELQVVSLDDDSITTVVLGPDVIAGEQPQSVVPVGAWQSARSLGPWSLVGCTVTPEFLASGFELAPPDWAP